MTAAVILNITSLAPNHDRQDFQCGVSALDNYLHQQARQDIRRGISRVFVATPTSQEQAKTQTIAGYYTLSSLSVECNDFPAAVAHKLPKHPVPAALLGRLAVATAFQGKGIGSLLLTNAIRRTQAVSVDIGIYALMVDAIDERAKHFYQQFGFIPLAEWPLRLFLPIASFNEKKHV